jgi:Ca2+-binding EF-hand superfamily protein
MSAEVLSLIAESTGLDKEQIDALKKGFEGFDKEGTGTISETNMMMILKSMDIKADKAELENYAAEVDEEGTGKFDLTQFATVASKFMSEDDEEQMREELKEAFRIYDKEGQGYITNDVLSEILREIDPTLTEDDLLNIIEEVDEDGSGTMDFDEFQEMMMG